VSCPVEGHAIRAIPGNQDKARPAANGASLAGGATPHWFPGVAPFGQILAGVRLCCTRLNWPQPVLHSRALPHIPPGLADSVLFYGRGH